ncbi:hypothetical protein SIAM614_28976 [Stappia aggregata IAM 12614]|uniref:Uncharacterized protein n=1 Tax=Roseibium aggregatum (strain ATCC 25650 / DSM 13394 / JCM 20685 / NBRC 16684 / NCIMB 2208 / IAM 12614 / B1) TaxID=384765 RepID=A0P115_ROSAI|nr:hypothetical protein [Roseibium aggregatum]EAV41200.1 hypothetical protein SIAM614_28976 [Stappia aggregata IAM 12614] [Roseibium aggregatum IAM 12614]
MAASEISFNAASLSGAQDHVWIKALIKLLRHVADDRKNSVKLVKPGLMRARSFRFAQMPVPRKSRAITGIGSVASIFWSSGSLRKASGASDRYAWEYAL